MKFKSLTAFLVAGCMNAQNLPAQSFQALGSVSRPAAMPAGAFGSVFTMREGRLAVWQARDSGRVALFDTLSPLSVVHLATINTPDSVFDSPAFGTKVALLDASTVFIGSPSTWLSAPHDGRVYAYNITNSSSPSLRYKFAESPHAAGYFGCDLYVEGDLLIAAQGSNAGSWQTRSAIFFYRINADKTVTLIGQQVRTSDFMNPVGCAISGDVCAAAFQLPSDTPVAGECWLFKINRTNGIPTSVSSPTAIPTEASPTNIIRAYGGWFFRIALKGSILAIANFGTDTTVTDNNVALFRVDTSGATATGIPVATIPAPSGASSRFGRRLLFAWNQLLISDPFADRAGTTAKGKIHFYAIDSNGSPSANGVLESQSNGATEAFGEFLDFDSSLPSGGVLGVACLSDVNDAGSDHTIQLFSALPEISVQEQGGASLVDGVASKEFGALQVGASSATVTYVIRNLGLGTLSGLAVSSAGANGNDFALGTLSASSLALNDSASFTVAFAPQGPDSGSRTGSVQISSNDSDENPFDIGLAGQAYSTTLDHDGDGMTDWGEFNLSALGFDWQVSNTALVSTLMTKGNTAGLFTAGQVQGMNVGTPLIQRNPITGDFRLTLGLEKSSNLSSFSPFPITAPQTSVTPEGKLEILFSVPDNAAFFRLQAQ